jgi:hypothetical protein
MAGESGFAVAGAFAPPIGAADCGNTGAMGALPTFGEITGPAGIRTMTGATLYVPVVELVGRIIRRDYHALRDFSHLQPGLRPGGEGASIKQRKNEPTDNQLSITR